MNPKFKTPEWWFFILWFTTWGLWSAITVLGKHLIPINILLLIFGFIMMFFCAKNEEDWFPPEPEGEDET